jgi:hypothetical protein
MPGHMNVLLAEASVPYEQLIEMDDINSELPETDVALVIGANDTVNPVARSDEGPLGGMPIIDADKARVVVIIKRSLSITKQAKIFLALIATLSLSLSRSRCQITVGGTNPHNSLIAAFSSFIIFLPSPNNIIVLSS